MAPRVGSGGVAGLHQRLLHNSAKSLEAKAVAAAAAAPPFKAAAPLQQQQLHAARVHQARLWSAVIAASLAVVAYIILFLVPPPPRGQRFQWALDGGAGLTFNDWGKVAAMAAAMGAALYALQEAVLRPAFSAFKPAAATEATFFASSLAVRAAFLGTLAARFWGALGGDLAAAAAGQAGGHRLPLIALFLAAYVTDLIQMVSEFFGEGDVGLFFCSIVSKWKIAPLCLNPHVSTKNPSPRTKQHYSNAARASFPPAIPKWSSRTTGCRWRGLARGSCCRSRRARPRRPPYTTRPRSTCRAACRSTCSS
jgi:hypothetical protein